ncbi:MAG: NACHT domain-containing protein, partial [Cyanobacteria bacterium J06634_6]
MTGSELLIGAAAEGIAALITDTTKTSSSSAIVSTIKGLKDKSKQAIFNASRKYVETYQKRHCQLKVLGMREPVDLASVYTGVKLLDSQDILQFDPEALEKTFRQSRRRGYSSGRGEEKQSGITMANEKQYLMVLGGPGAGKSTFLRKMGLEALRNLYYECAAYKPKLIPILLELKRFDSDDVDIAKFIAAEFETCGFPEAETFTQNALMQGNLLIMLDGLDEVPNTNLDNVLRTIRDFVDCYDENRFIASCRVSASGYRSSAFQRFSNVTMADFDDEQIQQFIGNWFGSEQDVERKTAEKCWEVLQKPENKASKELAHTPLLLIYLCLVYDLSQRFPNNRSSLYKKALRILLEEWAAEKRILRDEIYEGLNIELEEILLSEIAYDSFQKDQLFFSKRSLVRIIQNFLASMLNAPRHLDAEMVLNSIEVQQGVIVERAEDVYSFSHITIQEYLVAQYLSDNSDEISVVHNHITDKRWREIFLLVSGLMHNPKKLLLAIENQALEALHDDRIKQLLYWASQAEKKNKNFGGSVASTRAIFLKIGLDTIKKRDFATRKYLPDTFLSQESQHIDENLFNAIDSFILASGGKVFRGKTYHLDELGELPSMQALSREAQQTLAQYFYINELLLKAKDSAIRVNSIFWNQIEERLLLVKENPVSPYKDLTCLFLNQAGAEIEIDNDQRIVITVVPKGVNVDPPILVSIAVRESIEENIARSLGLYSTADKGMKCTQIILYRQPPTIADRLRIAEAQVREKTTLIPIPLGEVENAIAQVSSCKATFIDYVNRYIQSSNFFRDRNSISDKIFFFGRTTFLGHLSEEL